MSNGTIDASSPGVQVYRQAMGVYQVNFGQDITHCAPIASIGGVPIYGSPGASTGAVEGYVKTNVFSPGSNFGGSGYPSGDTVSVDLYSGGTDLLVDTSFYIAVFC
jgi:hypothetical protein